MSPKSITRPPAIETARLKLRRWSAEDLEPFASINADPEVMEHFPVPLSAAATAALIERNESSFEREGYGLWAAELRGEGVLIGMVGLMTVPAELPFAPAIEIGWRLGREFWGRGLAREAAVATIEFAFAQLALEEVLAYTAERNLRSRRLMERLEMSRDPEEDFSHPGLGASDPLAPHVLYRLRAPLER